MKNQSSLPLTTKYAPDSTYIEPPTNQEWLDGVEPGYTLPAKWWNYLMQLMTETNVTAKSDINSVLNELKSVLTAASITVNPVVENQLLAAINQFLALKSNLDSPSFTGTPSLPTGTTAVKQSVDDNTSKIATTSFVLSQAAGTAPLAPAVTAVIGTSTRFARMDHVHPANFTATATDIKMDGTQSVGALTTFPRADHVHPTDTSRAPLNSPAFTGTPSLPTGTTAVTQAAGTNTTQIATTAQLLRDAIPIGFMYIQFPTKALPATLYPGTTWTDRSPSFAGNFFRAAGGNALAFEAGEQAFQNYTHSHVASAGNDNTDHSHAVSGSTGNDTPDHSHNSNVLAHTYGGASSSGIDDGTAGNYIQTGGASTRHTHPAQGSLATGGRSAYHQHTITVNADGGAGEARPVNRTIRIWERTA